MEVELHAFLISSLISGETHAPSNLVCRKEVFVSTGQQEGCTPGLAWTYRQSLSFRESNAGNPASSRVTSMTLLRRPIKSNTSSKTGSHREWNVIVIQRITLSSIQKLQAAVRCILHLIKLTNGQTVFCGCHFLYCIIFTFDPVFFFSRRYNFIY